MDRVKCWRFTLLLYELIILQSPIYPCAYLGQIFKKNLYTFRRLVVYMKAFIYPYPNWIYWNWFTSPHNTCSNASNWILSFLFIFWESIHSSGLSFTREAFHFTIVKQYWDWVLIQIFSSRFAGCVYEIWNNSFGWQSAKFLLFFWLWVSCQTETKVCHFWQLAKNVH